MQQPPPRELSVKAEIGEGVAEKVIEAARRAEKIDFETAFDVMERRKDVGRITTGSKAFDELIGGGIGDSRPSPKFSANSGQVKASFHMNWQSRSSYLRIRGGA